MNSSPSFLPSVQRFLYGEGIGRGPEINQESPIRVFRRADVARVRMTYPDPRTVSIMFELAHVDLYFFYDIDIVILAMEIFADDLPLACVEDTMLRFARGYPTYWDAEGHGGHCLKKVEWLAADGTVLASSDYEYRQKYLSFACRYRAPCIASHWEFLLAPLVLHHSGKAGLIRYRQIESHLLPLMAYLAIDNPAQLAREDFIRLGLAAAPDSSDSLSYSEQDLHDFEKCCFYDRYWKKDHMQPGTRFICSGRVFTEVSGCTDWLSGSRKTGLEQFRHEYFVLFLISHFHKAAMTVVTTVGLIGMATTGFLGMNLIAEADEPFLRKFFILLSVLVPTTAVTLYTILKSRRLSEFLEKISDEHISMKAKFSAFRDVWRIKHDRVEEMKHR